LSDPQTGASSYDRTAQQLPRSEYIPSVHSPVEVGPKSGFLPVVQRLRNIDGAGVWEVHLLSVPGARWLSSLVQEREEERSFAVLVFAGVLTAGSGQFPSNILSPAKKPSLLGAPQDPYPIPEDMRVQVLDFAAIREAADRRDLRSFIAAVHGVNWGMRSAGELKDTIERALSLGAFVVAQQLAVEGARQHGDDASAKRLARMLAPARIVRTDLPADPGVLQNHEWLKKHASQYRGRWVALANGELLLSGDSIAELKTKLGGRSGVLLMRVP
jgi:hypothetical protein